MRSAVATERYLQRHIHPGLPTLSNSTARWQQVLVIPAFAESPAFLQAIGQLRAPRGRSLLIVVLNRPDSEQDSGENNALRHFLHKLPVHSDVDPNLFELSAQVDVYLHDVEKISGPLPASEGVGLARKIGCDLALQWIEQDNIQSQWIGCSDADALLPADYFDRLSQQNANKAAVLFPFTHVPSGCIDIDRATALYELRIHHYVMGLQHAHSPYAFHTLGSCLAINADAYAKCRGFPRRAGGEDFYLLNKLAKVGEVVQLSGNCIRLASRQSSRVPFGTGPAIEKLIDQGRLETETAYFYHPVGFEILRCLLRALPTFHESADISVHGVLEKQGIAPHWARATQDALEQLGWSAALRHCVKQAGDKPQFQKQLHIWLDGFKTLRLLHLLRNAGLAPLSLQALAHTRPPLWPTASTDPEQLRQDINTQWGWQAGSHSLDRPV